MPKSPIAFPLLFALAATVPAENGPAWREKLIKIAEARPAAKGPAIEELKRLVVIPKWRAVYTDAKGGEQLSTASGTAHWSPDGRYLVWTHLLKDGEMLDEPWYSLETWDAEKRCYRRYDIGEGKVLRGRGDYQAAKKHVLWTQDIGDGEFNKYHLMPNKDGGYSGRIRCYEEESLSMTIDIAVKAVK